MRPQFKVKRSYVMDADGKPYFGRADNNTQSDILAQGGNDPYKGASYSRRAGALWAASLGSADSDMLGSLEDLRSRSRDLKRNVPVAKGAFLTLEQNAIGAGLLPQPKIDWETLEELGYISGDEAEKKESQMKREFDMWGNTHECDVARRNDFLGLQRLAFHSEHENGDVLISLPMMTRPGSPFMTKVQLIEADRISNPLGKPNSKNLVMGVEKDDFGAPLKYWVQKEHPGNFFFASPDTWNWQGIEAFGKKTGRRNAWILMEQERVEQTRGVPYLAVVMEHLKQIERYTDAELMAAVIGGVFTVFITTENGEEVLPVAGLPFNTNTVDAFGGTDIALDYGAIIPLKPGEKIDTANPQRPNRVFGDFVRAILEQIGVGLGIPFELLIKHFTASYSAARAALHEAWNFFRTKRVHFSTNFCQPIYEAVITESVLRGKIVLPGYIEDPVARQAYLRCQWLGPAQGMLNPKDEADAAVVRIDAGLSSREIECQSMMGHNWQDIHFQLAKEKKARVDDGLEANPQVEIDLKKQEIDARWSAKKEQSSGQD